MIRRTWRGVALGLQDVVPVRLQSVGVWALGVSREGAFIFLSEEDDGTVEGPRVVGLQNLSDLQVGDVLLISPLGNIELIFRESWRHNFMLVTRRCDSLCLMCSQPPVNRDDSKRVESLIQAVSLLPDGTGDIGLTGGEPSLLGSGLVRLVQALRDAVPSRAVHILSNGRSFADPSLAEALGAVGHPDLMIGVPLYADYAALHDEVVGATGAFAETLAGLENLARAGVHVELRVVLHALTLPRLDKLALYIYRNLPYASQVVFMGLEPTGWAIRNLARLWVDPERVGVALRPAVDLLRRRGMRAHVYNLPLCQLPESLWDVACASISDWKNEFPPECDGCAAQGRCAGFFSSALSRGRKPVRVKPLAALDL